MLQVDVVRDFAELEGLAGDWNRLWRLGPTREVFGTLEWARAWWQTYGPDRELCTPVVREDDKVLGIWPLWWSGNSIRAVGMPRSDYIDLLCDPDDAAAVFVASLNALRKRSQKWSRLEIENIPETSNLARAVGESPHPWRPRACLEVGQVCSRIDFAGDEDAVRENLLGNKHLRRKEHRLSRFGPVAYRHLESRDEIRQRLPDFFAQHIGRRALIGENSMFSRERERLFYHNLVEELDPAGTLRFGVLTAGEETVAYHLGFEIEGKYVCYKPTFDADFSKWSPGEVLFRNIFRYVAENGLRACDFTVGEEGFKKRFATWTGHNRNLVVFRGDLSRIAGVGWLKMKAAIKQHPGLYGLLRKMRPTSSG
jgi:CelD/BcsL family acetyltransferase involved in cellulose biosynthesis